ncbi:MAG TPA: histidine phosphatase family protein [Anaerolineales bacterium]|nr:histidine phosphatase family protein [Anaerolineales bacterium]
MKKYLILVKHSLPEIIENVPARDWALSEEGRARAKRLAELLTRFQPELIVSSAESKARETAEIIAKAHHRERQIAEGLHEHDRSNVPYLTTDEFQASVYKLFQRPDQLVFGNETANQAYARFAKAVDSVLMSHAGKTIVMVAHGTVISLYVSRIIGISDLSLWKEMGLPSFLVLDLESNTLVARENNI